ncbi:MAG: HNH endonuclease signature motif containing protein, partial [Pseudomonadota bacterium]
MILLGFILATPTEAGQPRSYAAKRDFKAAYPCPATGKSKGACPGWVVDHIEPLACGGADSPENMQWQTVEDAKAKDKWERKGCEVK